MAWVNTHPPFAWLDNCGAQIIDRRFFVTGLFKAQLAGAPHLPMLYSHPGSSLSSVNPRHVAMPSKLAV
jgi:hypothetical protein